MSMKTLTRHIPSSPTPFRLFSTCPILQHPESTNQKPSEGFRAISELFQSSSSSSSSTSYLGPSSHTPATAEAVRAQERKSLPPKADPLLDFFANMLMKHGRKAEAQRHVSEILSMIQQTANSSPLPLLSKAITLSSPQVRMLSTRKRAKVIQTPRGLDERQRTRQGIVWLLKAAERGRKAGISRDQRVAREVFAVLEGNSDVYKWVEERHRVATANRSNLNIR